MMRECDASRPRESPKTYVKAPKKIVKEKKKRTQGKPKAPRKPKTPKTRAHGTMTESQYWGWIRSGLRRQSRFWPPATAAMKAASRPNQSSNKRLKTEIQCAHCRLWWPQKQIQKDHIIACGSLRNEEDLVGFIKRLHVEIEGWQMLCEECHTKKTAKDKEERDGTI